MNARIASLAVAWVLLGAAATNAAAQVIETEPGLAIWRDRWTYWLDAGANFIGATGVDAPFAQDDRYEVELKPGVRMDLGVAYRPLPWLRAGLETGYVWNEMKSLLGFDQLDGEITQVPVQAVIAVDQQLTGAVGFTLGAGVGGVYTRSSSGNVLREIDVEGQPVLDLLWREVGSNEFVAGYQVFAGLTYQLGRRTHLGLQYRFSATDPQNWTMEFWTGGEQTAQTDPFHNHSIAVLFRADF